MVKTVLIVDDNSTNLYLLKSLLEGKGFAVIAAENGQAALDRAHTDSPDLIVSDILMPIMDGYVLCRKCKADEQLRQIPFVFYTATYTDPKDEQFALSLGADRFVLKPQEPEMLIDILKGAMEKPSMDRSAAPKPLGQEMEFFRQYNEVLFKKLEKKMVDLEKASLKLKCLEEQYRLSFDNVMDNVWTIDAAFKIQKMSPSVEKMLGYKPQQFIGRSVFDFVKILTPESMERATAEISLTLSGQTVSASVYSLIAKDGAIKQGEISGSPIISEGKIVGIVFVTRDVTERKKMEDALQMSEGNFRRSIEESPLGIRIVSEAWKIVYINRAMLDIHGYDNIEQWLNTPATERYTAQGYAEVLSQRAKSKLSESEVAEYELDIIRKDGEVRHVHFWRKSIFWNGKAHYQIICRDITDQKRAEEALRDAYKRLDDIVDFMPDATFAVDRNGAVIIWNRTMEQMTGIPKRDILGKGNYEYALPLYGQRRPILIDFILRPNDDFDETGYDHVNRQDNVLYAESFAPQAHQGTGAFLWSTASILHDASGKIIGAIESVRDITERKKMEDALRISEGNFRRSMDESPLGIRIITEKYERVYANRAMLEIFGYDSMEEWLKIPTEKRYTEQSLATLKLEQERRRRGEYDLGEYELDIIRKDGEIRHTLVWSKKIFWNGKDHYQIVCQDITERKRAEESLKQTLDSLKKSITATIQVMVSAVESRDPYTAGHQLRVANLARAIATEMGLSKEKIEGIRMAASIHDIGKLSIPAEILSKPTKLSDIEYRLIKEHARRGYEILKEVESPWPLAEIVYQHHERMDGSGYPGGLTGEGLLVESRILAVADVVEAMASHRPYRPSLGIDLALDEIEKNRAVLYDATAANACLRLFREKGFKLEMVENL